MSREIDERIVQMKFDNTLFEKNVATSIGTLEKLKAALDFSGATNSLNNIERNVNAADFSKLANSVEAIAGRFSNWGIVGMTVIQDITRGIEGLAMKMLNIPVSKFEQAFNQIKTGGWTRATNIDKAKFAIEGLKKPWDELSKSIDKAVTDTRFGFDEAATAASQLVASNVAVGEEMDNALKSIANVASQTGDEYSSIAHIYTTIAGNGKLMTEQLNMFSYRGLNAAALLGEAMGKTEQEIREMTTKGEISFKQFSDAMNDALGEGAKRANDTFEGSMANMKAALSRIGQPFAETIRKYMPPVFNDLKEKIKELKTVIEPLTVVFDHFFHNATRTFRYFINGIDFSKLEGIIDTIGRVYLSISRYLKDITGIWDNLTDDLENRDVLIFGNIAKAAEFYNSFAESILDKKEALDSIPTSAINAMKKIADEAKNATGSMDSFADALLAKSDVFTGIPTSALEAMKAMAKGSGKSTSQIIADAYNELEQVTDLRSMAAKAIADEVTNKYDAIKKDSKGAWALMGIDNAGVLDTIATLAKEGKKVDEIQQGLVDTFHLSAEDAEKSINIVYDAIKKTGTYTRKTGTTVQKTIEKTTASIEHIDEVAKKVLRGEYGNGQERIDKLEKEGENWKLIQNRVNELVGVSKRYEVEETVVANVAERTGRRIAKAIEKPKTAMDAIKDMINSLSEKFKQLMDTVDKNGVAQKIGIIFNGIRDGAYLAIRIFSIFLNAALKPTFTFLQTVADAVLTTWATISEFISEFRFITETTDMLIELEGTLNFVFWQISNVGKAIVGLFTDIANAVGSALVKVNGFKFLYSIVDLIGSLSEKAIEIIDDIRINMDRDAMTDKIAAFLNGVIDGLTMVVRLASVVLNAAIKPLASLLTTIGSVLLDCAAAFGEWITSIKNAATESGFFENLEVVLGKIFWAISNVAQAITKMFGAGFLKAMDIVKNFTTIVSNFATRIKATFDAFKETESFKSLKKSLADLRYDFNQLTTKGRELIKKVFGGFRKAKIKLPTGPFDLLLKILTKVAGAVANVISLVVDKFDVDAFLKGVANLLKKVNVPLSKLGKTLKGAFSVALKGAITLFGKFGEAIKNLWGNVKNLWGSFKETKAFKTASAGFETVKDKASETAGKVKNFLYDAFHNDETGEFEFPKPSWEGIKQTWFNIWEWIKDRFFAAKTWIEGKISEIIGKEFHFPEINLEPLKQKFENIKNWFIDIFTNDETGEFEFPVDIEGAKEKIEGVKNWFLNLFRDEETGEITFDWEGVKKGFDDAIGWIQEKIEAIKKTFSDIFGGEENGSSNGEEQLSLFERLKKGVEGIITWMEEKVPILQDLLKGIVGGDDKNKKESGDQNVEEKLSIFDQIKNALPTLEDIEKVIGKLGEIVLRIQTFKATVGILESVFQVGEILRQVKGTLKQVKGVIKAYKKELKAEARELNARALLEVAIAIGIVAASFKLLSGLSWGEVAVGATCIGVITLALAALFALANSSNGKGLDSWQKAITTVLTGLGDGLKKIGSGLSKIGIAAIIVALTYAVTSIIGIMKELLGYDWSDAKNALKIVGAVLAELVVAVAALNIFDPSGFGRKIGAAVEIVAFAYGVKTICEALITLSETPIEQLKQAEPIMITLMAILAVCIGGMDLLSNDTIWQRLGSAIEIIAFAYGIKMIADALVLLSDTPVEGLEAARNAVALVLAALAAVIGAMTGLSDSANGNLLGPVEALLSAVGIIGTIVGAFYLIKEMEIDAALLEAAGTSLSLVVGAISALMLAINEITKATTAGAGMSLSALGSVLGEAGLAALITALVSFIGWAVGEFVSVEAIDQAAQTLEAITALIGRFFGGLIGGFVDSIGDQTFGDIGESIMSIPGKIKEFIEAFKPVLEDLKTVDSSGANALLDVLKVLVACFGAELLGSLVDGLLNVFNPFGKKKEAITEFGNRLKGFGQAIADYSSIVDGKVNEKAVQASANAGKMLADLENTIPNTGLSFLSVIMGDNKLNDFGDRLYNFGLGIVKFSAMVEGRVNEDAVTAAANSGRVLAALESDTENTGGVLSWIVGDNKLDDFGARLLKFGRCMRRFCGMVAGHIDQDAVDAATNAGTVLNELEKNLSDQDGKVKEFFFGGSGLDDFGGRLSEFGGYIVNFSDQITGKEGNGFNNTAVKNAVTTLDKLMDFVERIEGTDENGNYKFNTISDNIFDMSVVLDKIKTAFEKLGQEVVSEESMADTNVYENFRIAGETLAKKVIGGLKTGLIEVNEKTGQSPMGATLYKAIVKPLEDTKLQNSVTAKGKEIGKNIIEGLQKILSEDEEGSTFPAFVKEFVKSFQDLVYEIFTTMTNATPTFKARSEGWMKKLQEGINAYKESIIGSLKNIPIATLTFYGTQNSLFRSAGWNWMMELWDGINSGSSYVYELANSVASNVAGIIDGAVSKASAVPSGLSVMTDDFYTLGRRSSPMLNAMNTVADTGLRTATALEGAMNTASSNGQMAFQQLQSVAGIQNGAFSLSRDAGVIADTAAASMSRTASLARSASISSPVMSQVYVKDGSDTLEALNGMRRDIKVLTENMANMQMVLDSGVLVGQLTPGLDVSLSQRTRFKGRWA